MKEEKIGDIIKRRREEIGITAKELAERAGISAAYLSKIENRERNTPSWEILGKIEMVLGVEIRPASSVLRRIDKDIAKLNSLLLTLKDKDVEEKYEHIETIMELIFKIIKKEE